MKAVVLAFVLMMVVRAELGAVLAVVALAVSIVAVSSATP